MNSKLPRILAPDVDEYLTDVMAERGRDYAEDQRVRRVSWDAEGLTLSGEVVGSGSNIYRARIWLTEAALSGPDCFEPTSSDCSCPVGYDCKHVGAILYSIADYGDSDDTASPRTGLENVMPHRAVTPQRPDDWRTVLTELQVRRRAHTARPEDTPLAIGFDIERTTTSRWFHGRHRSPLASADVVNLSDIDLGSLSVTLRPLRRGARNNWIKGGLGWRNFTRGLAGPPGIRRDHAAALSQLHAQNTTRSYTYGSEPDTAVFSAFDSSLVWLLLARAQDTGVELTGYGRVSEVRIVSSHSPLTLTTASGTEKTLETADVIVDVVRQPGGYAFTALIDFAGTVPENVFRIGDNAIAFIDRLPGNTLRLTVAETSTPVSEPLGEMLASRTTLSVPDHDAEVFFTEFLPELRGLATLTSHDASAELPEFRDPRLHVEVEFEPEQSLLLTWSWEYYGPKRRLPVTHSSWHHREPDLERAVLEEIRRIWPTAATVDEEHLIGIDAAKFAVRVLPRLEDHPEIVVEISGERIDYTELTAPPQVRVTTEPTDDRDWFDLAFEVTIEGKRIPFAPLFAALAQHKSHLQLVDNTFFSLDHPAFDRLRELLQEAEALGEWEPERSKISRHQVSIWDDLVELADEAVPAREWRESIGRLGALEELPAPEVPAGVRAELRGYQLDGFRWLAFLWEHSLGGILADDMGLGKTLQTLTLIAHAHAQAGRTAAQGTAAEAAAPFLVVAPSSVVPVWQAEAARFTPDLKVVVLDTTTHKRKQPVAEAIAGADVVLTSYTIFRINGEEFTALPWGGFVLDEAQFVKNQAAKTYRVARDVRSPFTLAITGTPMENSLTDLWSLLSLTAPGLFASPVKFKEEYVKPIEKGAALSPESGVLTSADGDAAVQERLNVGRQARLERLRRRVRPFMLRRTKDLVAAELPAKQEHELHVPLEPKHKKLYDLVLQRERKKVLGMVGDLDKHRMTVFRSLTLLRMLALSPPIVSDDYADVPSSKLEALFSGLDEVLSEGHRIIVFSQFTSCLRLVAERFDTAGVDYAYLDGSTSNRGEVIDGFRSGTAPVFLISLKAGGFGLTLTEADYVFLLDPWWNPAAEAQAIDRTHRIGQTKNVMVYRLVAAGTIEEKVLALQQKKARLFDALMDDGRAFSTALTADDVRELFAPAD
ncbi:SNF2-related protein [Brevibacterium otitidis]|uniref:SNF2-related protein n=1 Tax=Brevibacterium otitidis TaxID=53364 RepID=A0ABV5X313_9MICO|nr:DEAD/DEAH box helicase [Brevibacterium otitidis]